MVHSCRCSSRCVDICSVAWVFALLCGSLPCIDVELDWTRLAKPAYPSGETVQEELLRSRGTTVSTRALGFAPEFQRVCSSQLPASHPLIRESNPSVTFICRPCTKNARFLRQQRPAAVALGARYSSTMEERWINYSRAGTAARCIYA